MRREVSCVKKLSLEFLHVTQSAAMAAVHWVGRGKKNEADHAATAAMREALNQIPMDAAVVIGEGEMDEAPMLWIGEKLGDGTGPQLDIAVDPVEGTDLVASGRGNSIAVIAAAPRGSLLHAPDMYMEKMAVGPGAAGAIDIDLPIAVNLDRVAAKLGKRVSQLSVMVQQRPRHERLIDEILKAGAKVRLFGEGDVTGAVVPALPDAEIDMFVGIGGAPEGVLSAVAIRCLGGDMQARLLPADEHEYDRCRNMGIHDPRRRLSLNDLVATDDCLFVATGITSGMLLEGVKTVAMHEKVTHSLLIVGASRWAHFIHSRHPGTLAG